MSLRDLSIAIMTHNESREFSWLLERLAPILTQIREMVVVDDFSRPEMIDLIKGSGAKLFQRRLNGDFSAQRNYMKSLCCGKFILVLDPDELPSPGLLQRLGRIIELAEISGIDVCAVPRLNIVHDGDGPVHDSSYQLTDERLQKQRPDRQPRIIRNAPHVKWVRPVHERVVGARKGFMFPEKIDFAIVHIKHRRRALAQNEFYDTIAPISPAQLAGKIGIKPIMKRLAKPLGFLREPIWVDLPAI